MHDTKKKKEKWKNIAVNELKICGAVSECEVPAVWTRVLRDQPRDHTTTGSFVRLSVVMHYLAPSLRLIEEAE